MKYPPFFLKQPFPSPPNIISSFRVQSIWGQQKVTQVQCAGRTDLHLGFPRVGRAVKWWDQKKHARDSCFKKETNWNMVILLHMFFFIRYIDI